MIIGVGFMLFTPINGVNKLFTVRELKDKPAFDKKSGEITFPMETKEQRDQNLKAVFKRLVEEEIGISFNGNMRIVHISKEEFRPIPGRKDVLVFYGIGKFYGDPNQKFQPRDDDVIFSGWRTVEEMLSGKFPVRHGVISMLEHFLKNNVTLIEQK
jgi:hypothetical protein